MALLIILSILAAIVGFFVASEATFGVSIIGLGCLLAIFARISQARAQHEELLELLQKSRTAQVEKPPDTEGVPGNKVPRQAAKA